MEKEKIKKILKFIDSNLQFKNEEIDYPTVKLGLERCHLGLQFSDSFKVFRRK